MADDKAQGRVSAPHRQGEDVRIDDDELPPKQLRGEGVEDPTGFQNVDRGRVGEPKLSRVSVHHLLQERELSLSHKHAVAADAPESEGVSNEAAECQKKDRKSTRLNSSHQIISYAVFCLKKKN